METMGVFERPEITRRRLDEAEKETGGIAAGFFYEGDTMDDELSKLMPSLKRQLEAIDDDEGTLNFMGEINMTEESFRRVAKENVVFNRNSIREARRRRGSSKVTTSQRIDFNKLLASNKTVILAPSSSFYEKITPVLKENVNRAGNQSQIVDDFWSTGKKRKISAVARRRLSGIKTPAPAKPKAVEDRNARHARSRLNGGRSRTMGRRPVKLDLRLDAAKISEWDQETLAEEEVPSTRAYSGAFMTAGKSAADAEEEVPPSTRAHSGAPISAGGPAEDAKEVVPPSTRARSGVSVSGDRTAADSPGSLLDMELSPGQSPHVELPERSGSVEGAQTRLEDAGNVNAGFPVPESNPRIPRVPLTSPTPPSNPVAAYMSLRHLKVDVGQRRLSFLSSPSIESSDTGGSQEGEICTRSQHKNALPTLSNDYSEDDEDLKVPDVEETEPHDKYIGSSLRKQTEPNEIEQNQEDDEDLKVLDFEETEPHHKYIGSSLGKQTEPNVLEQNQEESFGEVPIENEAQVLPHELQEAEDREAAPPFADAHQNNPPTEGLTGTDEGSTTHTKPKRAKRRVKNAENKRFSLEGCGSIWKEGQRRSQRIKLRPLEWWRGEKILYGRIHDTLGTVIGVKFSSPGKYARGIDEPFVVESYVPPQYSELVRFAAI